MSNRTLTKIVALGALTGMRSMAGLAILAWPHRGTARPVMLLASVGEMMADKTPWIGDRTDPLPMAGRAMMGAVVGALIAGKAGEKALLGAMLGAGSALVATHLAYHVRKRLPLPGAAGGLLEDALVIAVASRVRT